MLNDISNQKFLLGVDTGSSKTHALVTDLHGKIFGFGESGCGNHEMVGVEGFMKALNKATDEAIDSAGIKKDQITSMGFGFSGYDWPSEAPIMEMAIQSLAIECPFQFVNDVTLGLIAGSSEGWGIAVDAGTGNNVRGRDKYGKMGRITGDGIQLGELGGASEIVWRAMIAANYAWSKRGPATNITQVLMKYAQLNSEDALIESLATGKIYLPAELAKDIIQLAVEGDGEAQKAVTYVARELALSVNSVVRQLNFQEIQFEIVMLGSVFKAGAIYTKPFMMTIKQFAPYAQFIHLATPPVVGAVLLAGETLGINKPIKKALIQSMEGITVKKVN